MNFNRLLACSLLAMTLSQAHAATERLYIGTYTRDSSSVGVYTLTMDTETGALSTPRPAAQLQDPTFLALNPVKPVLYATSHVAGPDGSQIGALTAFSMDPVSGDLRPLNQREIAGKSAPCYVVVDPTGRTVLDTQYNEGIVASFPVQADGSLGPIGSLVHHAGKLGPNKERQDHPHAHSFVVSLDDRFAFACDLAMDRLVAYRLDSARGTIVPAPELDALANPGAGPRHSVFSKDARFLYVVTEMGGTVQVFSYEAATGKLSPIQTISALPDGFKGLNTSAEICISPDGRFVYASDRGPDLIAIFSRDPQTGLLTRLEQVPCGGKHPRNFALSPDGRWLVCANRDTNNLAVFRVNRDTGRLTLVSNDTQVPKAVCVLFVPPAKS